MTQSHQQHALKAIAVFALLSVLLLLLLPHTAAHAAPLLWLAMVPVLLFGIIDIQSSQWMPAQANRPARPSQPARSALFQHPLPSA